MVVVRDANFASFVGSSRTFILRCDACTMEILRKKRPPAFVSCGRCERRSYDPRFQLRVFEVVDMRDVSDEVRAAQRGR